MTMLDSKIVKDYGLQAGASVVGIAASKDFGLSFWKNRLIIERIWNSKKH